MRQELLDKITLAQHRIEELWNETDGKCFVSFSGGKDSTVLLALIKSCEELMTIPKDGVRAVFCNTGVELDATIEFVNWVKENYYPNTEIIKPKYSFSGSITRFGKPISSKLNSKMIATYQRKRDKTTASFKTMTCQNGEKSLFKLANKNFHLIHDDFDIKISYRCCINLKKHPFEVYRKEHGTKGYFLGERIAEGGYRKQRALQSAKEGGKICQRISNGIITKLPIVDWLDIDVEEYIAEFNVPLSRAYTEYGCQRTGCIGCPYAKDVDEDLYRLFKFEPNKYKASMFWLKDVYIAQNIKLPFDEDYEIERVAKWKNVYSNMRYESLLEYQPKVAEKWKNKDGAGI